MSDGTKEEISEPRRRAPSPCGYCGRSYMLPRPRACCSMGREWDIKIISVQQGCHVTDTNRTSNRVSIVIQRPGEVPDRKGPYSRDLVESALRELYSRYPGIVCIVMPGLPADCWPQHGHEYLDMVDAERCKCEVDAPRNPMCLVDHTRRVTETSAAQNVHSDEWWQAELDRCVGIEQGKYRAMFDAYSELKAGDPDITAGVRPAVEPSPIPASIADQASIQRVGSAVAGGGSENGSDKP